MNAREFIDKYGRVEAQRVALEAGTSMAYLEQLAGGFRRPSFRLAELLTAASSGRMDTLALMRGGRPVRGQRDGSPEAVA